MVERSGLHLFGELKKSPAALERFTKREWISILNAERDWLKHGGRPHMEIHCSTAAFMIDEAHVSALRGPRPSIATTKIENWTDKMVRSKIWILDNLDQI